MIFQRARKPDEPESSECERFLREGGFYEAMEREAQGAMIGAALYAAGYVLARVERIPLHKLLIIKGSRPAIQEPRSVPRIRRALLRAFRTEGFKLRADLLHVRFAGRCVLVSVGLLDQ